MPVERAAIGWRLTDTKWLADAWFVIGMKYKLHLLLGILAWTTVTIAVAGVVGGQRSKASRTALVDYFTKRPSTLELTDASSRLRRNDPVFMQDSSGQWSQVGHVERGRADDKGQTGKGQADDRQVRIRWYGDVDPDQLEWEYHYSSGRLEEVVQTMLPPEKRAQIQQRFADLFQQHGREMTAALLPLVEESLRRSVPIVEKEFRAATRRHRDEIDELALRWNEEVIDERLIPLARREIMPSVRRHGQPLAEEIGRELWDRASLWRFGWRALYDKAPLPQRNLVRSEWDRFVEQEAEPVFRSHSDDIVGVVQRIMTDVASNRNVRRELGEVAESVASDPDARALVRVLLKESLLENQELRDLWKEIWTSDRARSAIDLAGDRIEPVVRSIGDDLFGTPEDGINPDFARVLRNQILGKDRRWIVATAGDADSAADPVITIASGSMPYPLVYMADGIDPFAAPAVESRAEAGKSE